MPFTKEQEKPFGMVQGAKINKKLIQFKQHLKVNSLLPTSSISLPFLIWMEREVHRYILILNSISIRLDVPESSP